MKKEKVIKYIKEYDLKMTYVRNLFVEHFDSKNPLVDWKKGKIPKTGKMEEVAFEFHGRGVFITEDKLEYDIEFGEPSCFKSFDAWRLLSYIENFEKNYTEIELSDYLNWLFQYSIIESYILPHGKRMYRYNE